MRYGQGVSYPVLALMIAGAVASSGVPAPAHTYGMNLTANMRRFNNIATSAWRGDAVDGGFATARSPYIDDNGDVVAFPSGITQMLRAFGYPNAAGIKKRFALTWTGTHTTGASGTVRLNNLGSALITNVTYAANRIEFDWEMPNPIPADPNTSFYMSINTTGWSAGDPVKNIDCREISGVGGAVIDAGNWHIDFINYIKARGDSFLRFMDFMFTNTNIYQSGTGAFTWAMRATKLTNCPSSRSRLTIGTGNSTLRFQSPDYLRTTESALAAQLPDHGFGTNGNNTTIQIVAGAGSLTVATSGTGQKDILVTLASGGSTVNAVIAAIVANVPAYTRVVCDKPSGDGSGACPTLAKTNLADGYDGSGRDQIPAEMLIELCNLTSTRPWFNMPVNADATFVSNYATLVNSNLNAARRPAMFELGNEPTWNFAFPSSGWLAGWGVKNGRTGPSIGEYAAREYAARFVSVMPGVRSVMADAKTIAGGQAANTTYTSLYEAASGFAAAATDIGIAPYFYADSPTDTYVGSGTDAAWLNNGQSIVNTTAGYAANHLAICGPNGHGIVYYEGGQHDISSSLTDMQRRQRSTMMGFLYGYYLSEHRRRANVGAVGGIPFPHYADMGPIGVGASGAWGMQEYRDQPRIDAPKYNAWLNAIAGIFPAYMVYPNIPTATGIRMVGADLTVTIPAFYNAVSATIRVVRDGTPIGSPIALSVPGTPAPQQFTYTQVTADGNTKIEFRVALTNSQGDVNFIDYITNSNTTTLPFTKYVEITSFPFTVPADYNQTNGCDVFVVGAGGRGLAASSNGSARIHGGGGGAFSSKSYTNEFAAGASISGFIAAEGSEADTWFRSNSASDVMAKAGTNAPDGSSNTGNGKGGLAANGFGTTKFSGGDGAASTGINLQGGGGGGAAGPNGNGASALAPGNYGSGGAGCNGGSAGTIGGFDGAQIGGDGGNNRGGTGKGLGGTSARDTTAGTNGGGGGGGGGNTITQRAGGNNSMDPVWQLTSDGTFRGPGSGAGGQLGSSLGQLPGQCVAGYGGGSPGRFGSGAVFVPARPGGIIFAYRP